jgi:dihydroorotate dehydrogenase electron transfer subunit
MKDVFGKPQMTRIKKVIKETDHVKTFIFDLSLGAKPGQFVNIWIPGVDEKPFSVAWDDGNEFAVTFFAVGPLSTALSEKVEGDKVGIRGPYGTNYTWENGETLALVAGGYGAAPMYFVTLEALKNDCKVHFIVGARGEEHLLFIDRVKELPNVEVHISTDDGSVGFKGYNTQVLEQVLKEGKVDRVFACGPEVMENRVVEICEEVGVPGWVSVERYMKCGFGVCGHCCMDDTGDRVCMEGPVMSSELLSSMPEFGEYHRDKVSRKDYL